MKIRASARSYLEKASNTSWADCLAATATVGGEWANSGSNLYAGKRYVADDATNKWRFFQTFLRFDLGGIPDQSSIDAVTLRIYLADADLPETDFGLYAKIISGGYGTLAADDWLDSLGGPALRTTVNTSTVTTDKNVNYYIDIPFTANMLSNLSHAGSTANNDIALLPADLTTAPTDKKYLDLYAYLEAGVDLTAYLDVTVTGRRERIMAALISRIDEIDEYSGYNTTPTVSRVYQPLATLDRGSLDRIAPIRQVERRVEGLTFTQQAQWDIVFALQRWHSTQSTMDTAINQFIDDFTRVIDSDAEPGSNRLDLAFVTNLWVSQIDGAAEGIIDDNKAEVHVTVTVQYRRIANEG